MQIYFTIAIALAWISVILRSYFPLYLTNNMKIPKVTLHTDKIIIIALLINLISNIIFIEDNQYSYDVLIIFIIYLVMKYLINYTVKTDNFHSLEMVKDRYNMIAEEVPEMIVITIKENIMIIPLKSVMANDLILKDKISLTFCLLCNSVHAYELPEINGKVIRISSHGGSEMNGNKILYDDTGRYVWQQLNGEGLSEENRDYPLKEISINRILWKFVAEIYPNAEYYISSIRRVQYLYYKLLRNIVRKVPLFKFTTYDYDKSLPAKMPVAGISIMNVGSKVYPMSIFTPGEMIIFTDNIKDIEFTLLFDGYSVIAFSEVGIELIENEIEYNNKRYTLTGIGEYDNLTQLVVTNNVFWYMYNQMYPDAEIYE